MVVDTLAEVVEAGVVEALVVEVLEETPVLSVVVTQAVGAPVPTGDIQ